MKKKVNLIIDKDILDMLDAVAKEQKRSRHNLIVLILERFVGEKEK